MRKLADGAVEPPFLIGTACASCHVAFDPAKPPADPAHPQWENLSGLVGNQYIRISEILISGMPHDDLLWQTFAHARPGTSDTSAIPNDQVNNAGTINALINTAQRPTFAGESVNRWRKVARVPGRCRRIRLLVRARQTRQVLGKRASPPKPCTTS